MRQPHEQLHKCRACRQTSGVGQIAPTVRGRLTRRQGRMTRLCHVRRRARSGSARRGHFLGCTLTRVVSGCSALGRCVRNGGGISRRLGHRVSTYLSAVERLCHGPFFHAMKQFGKLGRRDLMLRGTAKCDRICHA